MIYLRLRKLFFPSDLCGSRKTAYYLLAENRSRQLRITKRTLDELQTPSRDMFVWDEGLKGFGVKITPKGKRVFVLQSRLHGRSIRLTIGAYGQPWSPDTARSEAMRLLGELARGIDPRQSKQNRALEMTVEQLCEVYFRDACGHKKPATVVNERGKARRHIVPLLGKILVSTLTKATVQKFLYDVEAGKTKVDEKTGHRGRAIVTGGPAAANRTFGLLSAMLTYAVDLGVRPDNPATGVKQFKLLEHNRYLSPDELGRLGAAWKSAENEGINIYAILALKLLLLTGCRKSEVLGLRWSWIDIDRGIISLPDSKTGARHVPFGDAAQEVLKSIPRLHGSPYVFPSTRDAGRLVGLTKLWHIIRAKADLKDVRIHDFRHNYASSAVSAGESVYVVANLLGHSQVRTTQRYAHLSPDSVNKAADRTSSGIAALVRGSKDDERGGDAH